MPKDIILIPDFVRKEEIELLLRRMDEADSLAGKFTTYPYTLSGEVKDGIVANYTLELAEGYGFARDVKGVLLDIFGRWLDIANESFSFPVLQGQFKVFFMGLRLSPEGTGPTGFHKDGWGRADSIIALSNASSYEGGVVSLRLAEQVIFESRLNSGDLLLFDDNKYEHNRTSCSSPTNTRRRTILSMKVNPS